jgi:hypothetical protein
MGGRGVAGFNLTSEQARLYGAKGNEARRRIRAERAQQRAGYQAGRAALVAAWSVRSFDPLQWTYDAATNTYRTREDPAGRGKIRPARDRPVTSRVDLWTMDHGSTDQVHTSLCKAVETVEKPKTA